MIKFREQEHPRDEDGKFTDKGKGKKGNFMEMLREEERKNNQPPKLSKGIEVKNVLYHQTALNSLSEFNESKRKAGVRDIEVPKGIFLKDTDDDIGLFGKKQLALSVSLDNALVVSDRTALVKITNTNIDIKNLRQQLESFDDYTAKEIDRMSLEAETDADYEKIDRYIANIEVEESDLSNKLQILTQEYLKELGYDGVVIERDKGSMGRNVRSTIVFDLNDLSEV